jgi:hypothetical protein
MSCLPFIPFSPCADDDDDADDDYDATSHPNSRKLLCIPAAIVAPTSGSRGDILIEQVINLF